MDKRERIFKFPVTEKLPLYEPDIDIVPVDVIVPPVQPFPVATEVTPLDVTYPALFDNWVMLPETDVIYPAPFVRVLLFVGIVGLFDKSL